MFKEVALQLLAVSTLQNSKSCPISNPLSEKRLATLFEKNAWHNPLGKSICTHATAEAATPEAKRLTCARNGHTHCTQDMQPIQRVGYQNLRVVCLRPN